MDFKKIIREPLLHFLLIGAGFFLLYQVVGAKTQDREKITIDDDDINHIVSVWQLQWKRPPTQEELVALINTYIREEILYREGIKMGLDRNDEMIKRRIAQKMDFVSNDVAAVSSQPDDATLEEYFRKHASRYTLPPNYSFYLVGASPDKHDDPAEALKQITASLSNLHPEAAAPLGDKMPFPFHLVSTDSTSISREMGGDLSARIGTLPLNQWVGPVSTGFGLHMLYIATKQAGKLPDFAAVKHNVALDYQYENEQNVQQEMFSQIGKNYEINIESVVINNSQAAEILAQIKKADNASQN